MPTIWYEQGFRFSLFSADGAEPPHVHVHVRGSGGRGKWWLDPVAMAYARGFRASERGKIARVIQDHQGYMLRRWRETFPEAQ